MQINIKKYIKNIVIFSELFFLFLLYLLLLQHIFWIYLEVVAENLNFPAYSEGLAPYCSLKHFRK